MDSGNLARQARAIRQRYPNRKLLAVQDDDDAGRKACGVALEAGFNGVIDLSGMGA
jgi:phage/plasmid primase-like uncharacterized protein